MDEDSVINLINKIKTSNNTNFIYKILVSLRTELIKNTAGITLFYTCNGIPPIVRLISKPYEQILDVGLSILGNCCVKEECCKQAIQCGVLKPLLTILRCISNESIQTRACRLLGNLARESKEKICDLTKGIGIVLASLIEDCHNIQSLTMALRVVRILWNELQFKDEFIRSGGDKKIKEILLKNATAEVKNDNDGIKAKRMKTTHSDIQLNSSSENTHTFHTPTDKHQLNLLAEVFRCIQIMTVFKSYSDNIFEHDEAAYNYIVYFAQEHSPFRCYALKTIANLTNNYKSAKIIQGDNVVKTICDLITKTPLVPPLIESEKRHTIRILACLATDACNRAKIRNSGAFKRILEFAKITKCDKELKTILNCLESFRYDDISIDLLIKMGMVSVLIEVLDDKTKDLPDGHKISWKYYKNEIVKTESGKKILKLDINQLVRVSCPNSPCSSTSLSPNNSPFRQIDDNDFKDSEYSPVCSDIEDNNEEDDIDQNTIQKLFDECDKIEFEDGNNMDIEQNDTTNDEAVLTLDQGTDIINTPDDLNDKKVTIECIISILSSVAYRMKQMSSKAIWHPKTFDALAKTCRVAYKGITNDGVWYSNGAPYILKHIICETNFLSILKQRFVFEIYEMTQPIHQPNKCNNCEVQKIVGLGVMDLLNKLGETGYGQGEMAHILLKGDKKMHNQIAVIVTYIIRNAKIIQKLLIDCNAINTVIEIILSNNEELCKDAAIGLTALSSTFDVKIPNYIDEEIDVNLKFDELKIFCQPNIDNVITFIVGDIDENEKPNAIKNDKCDLHRIAFDGELLEKFADYFKIMLTGNFRESNEKEIKIKNQSVNGIKYFLDSILQISSNQKLNIPSNEQIDSILETYDLCQMYLLQKLETFIYNMILFKLNSETVLNIFEFSLRKHKQELTELALNYYFCSNINGDIKVKMYQDANKSVYGKKWNELLLDKITDTINDQIIIM